jgi:hypothetical protein
MFSILYMFACFMGNGPDAEEVAAAEEATKALLAIAEGAATEGDVASEAPPADKEGEPGQKQPFLCDPDKTRMHELKVSKNSEIKFKKDSTFDTDAVYEVWVGDDNNEVIGNIKMTVKDGTIMSGEASEGGFIFCAYNIDFGYDGFPIENFCVKPDAFQSTSFKIQVTGDFYEYTLANCNVKVEG